VKEVDSAESAGPFAPSLIPDIALQASCTSAAPCAPYATSENVPKLKQSSYRPTAPFSTSDDAPQSPSAPMSRRHTHSSSLRAPFASHDELPTDRPVTPSAYTAHSSSAPFDNDNQPALLPSKPRFRISQRPPDTCPYDREDVVKPQARTAPTATYALSSLRFLCRVVCYFRCQCVFKFDLQVTLMLWSMLRPFSCGP
jgi:hypothetical protein